MINFVKSKLRQKSFQDLGIVFSENLILKALAFILIIVVARVFGPEEFGIYSLITVSVLFLKEFLDLGAENTAIRFSGQYQAKRDEIFGLFFLYKTVFLLLLFLLIFFSPELISKLLNKPQASKYIYIIFAGCVVESYLYVIVTYYQSLERFSRSALLNIGVYSIRLTAIFTLLKLSMVDIKLISIAFVLSGVPVLFFTAPSFAAFMKKLVFSGMPKKVLVDIFHYEKWMIFAMIPMVLMTRLDFYIASSFLSFKDIGLYNSAFELSGMLAIILIPLRKVLFPKVSKYQNIAQIKEYIVKVVKVSSVVSLLFVMLSFLSKYIIFIFMGKNYLGATKVLQILFFANLCTFWNVMFSLVFYSAGESKIMAMGAYLQLSVFVVMALSFVTKSGMEGVAWSRFFSNAVYLAFVVYYLPRVLSTVKVKNDQGI